jgi:hypothetical protein
MVIPIPSDKMVKAQYSEAWAICLWGNPKMTVVCGHCSAKFETRDYIPHKNTGEILALCPYCTFWNMTGLADNSYTPEVVDPVEKWKIILDYNSSTCFPLFESERAYVAELLERAEQYALKYKWSSDEITNAISTIRKYHRIITINDFDNRLKTRNFKISVDNKIAM